MYLHCVLRKHQHTDIHSSREGALQLAPAKCAMSGLVRHESVQYFTNNLTLPALLGRSKVRSLHGVSCMRYCAVVPFLWRSTLAPRENVAAVLFVYMKSSAEGIVTVRKSLSPLRYSQQREVSAAPSSRLRQHEIWTPEMVVMTRDVAVC